MPSWNAMAENSWLLAVGTIAFFTVKGLLWLTVPFVLYRLRKLFASRHLKCQPLATDASSADHA